MIKVTKFSIVLVCLFTLVHCVSPEREALGYKGRAKGRRAFGDYVNYLKKMGEYDGAVLWESRKSTFSPKVIKVDNKLVVVKVLESKTFKRNKPSRSFIYDFDLKTWGWFPNPSFQNQIYVNHSWDMDSVFMLEEKFKPNLLSEGYHERQIRKSLVSEWYESSYEDTLFYKMEKINRLSNREDRWAEYQKLIKLEEIFNESRIISHSLTADKIITGVLGGWLDRSGRYLGAPMPATPRIRVRLPLNSDWVMKEDRTLLNVFTYGDTLDIWLYEDTTWSKLGFKGYEKRSSPKWRYDRSILLKGQLSGLFRVFLNKNDIYLLANGDKEIFKIVEDSLVKVATVKKYKDEPLICVVDKDADELLLLDVDIQYTVWEASKFIHTLVKGQTYYDTIYDLLKKDDDRKRFKFGNADSYYKR